MTAATATASATVRAALARADRRYAESIGDQPANPGYLDKLAAAVEAACARDTLEPVVDAAETLRLQDLVDELRKTVEGHSRTVDRQRGEITALKLDRDQAHEAAAAARADAQARVDKAAAAGRSEADTLRARVDELRIDLAQARKETAEAHQAATTWESEYERVRDQKLDDIVELAAPVHVHGWVLSDTGRLDDCTCGLAYPRDTLAQALAEAADDAEEIDEEPLATLFARIRDDLAGWGQR